VLGSVPEASDILETVRCLLDAPHLAWLWDEGGLSEVPLMGWVDGTFYTGRVDRLIVRAHDVVIVDFKTDHVPKAEVPAEYRRQLHLYGRLAEKIYSLPVMCAVLWTVTGQLTWLTDE
jgi:ATP-dependent helicase/nuclease subunit A